MRKVLVLAALAIAEVVYGQPTISAVYVSASTSTTATIVWTTNTPATSQIRYGYDNTLPFSNNTNHTLTTSHSMTLTLLNASQPYYFAAVSVDGSSHSAQSSTYEFALCGNPQVPVSGSINQFYYSGTFSMTWNPPSGSGGTPTVCGQPVTTPVSGSLNLNGTFTTQVSDSLKVTPGPGTWTVAVADIGNISPISVTLPLSATSPDISSQLQTAAAGTSLVGVIANNISHTCWPSFVCSGVGSGITDINSQTGPAITFQSSGSTVTITSPSANVINLESAGGGGGVPSVNAITGAVIIGADGTSSVSTDLGTGTVTIHGLGIGFPPAAYRYLAWGDSRYTAGTFIGSLGNDPQYQGNVPNQIVMQPALNGGNANSGTVTITSCTVTNTTTTPANATATLTYTGTTPYIGEIVRLSGLTGTNCSQINASTALANWNVSAIGSGTFTVDLFRSDGSCSTCGPIPTANYTGLSLADATEAQTGATGVLYGNLKNASIPGYTVAYALSDYATFIHPLSPAVTGHPATLISDLAGNDILLGTSLSTVENALSNPSTGLWKKLRDDGWTIMWSTVLPLPANLIGCGNAPTCQALGQQYNAWLRAQINNPSKSTGIDELVDISQTLPNNLDLNVYNSDNAHPTNAGVAEEVPVFVTTLINRSSSPTNGQTCFPSNACVSSTTANTFTAAQAVSVTGVPLTLYNNSTYNLNVASTYDLINLAQNTVSLNMRGCVKITTVSTGFLCLQTSGFGPANSDYLSLVTQDHRYDDLKVFKTGMVQGDTAPTGSCPVSGVWQFTKDGFGSFCKAGTWEVAVTAP